MYSFLEDIASAFIIIFIPFREMVGDSFIEHAGADLGRIRGVLTPPLFLKKKKKEMKKKKTKVSIAKLAVKRICHQIKEKKPTDSSECI